MRVLVCGRATIKIAPPCPPSPPLGPPRGTNSSRRNARQPFPPSPATTWMSTSSTNIRAVCWCLLPAALLQGQDADEPAVRAVVFGPHAPVDLREDRVVFPQACVSARSKPPSPLPHDDRAAGDDIAV